ncbi:Transcriptional regulator, IclR family [Pseudonocardia sp. Ae168_Ps1]|uniref:IclR family transcriptional regulator n=1 Tax=unclassified Pseudonocardia TaxID=2619320 RepID=UPI00094B4E12|nr:MULTISPECIES: IclR family transcriptional regulator [unclassified Pseudonocardia]OLL73067.1 Transcriptional regulator, IclR family [Pseudonocardia sp. Ae150A_Ps1]OLL79042.1 Transcriptional regulator, IclR family [Pseudonocardia sp. Ae168_Ps1]OLL86820.1 Transcriptional regulator, IclR family [Pseudonocardia sp. Ae263_Ps1]OLL93136.1 Transcriptional regulator, IclR family [Pseudonocardia sp. Ae356_Ps1]
MGENGAEGRPTTGRARDSGAAPRGPEIQSVARASTVLGLVVDSGEGLTTTEIAKITGMTGSTVHRLAHTLVSGNLLCRDAASDRFLPGPLLLRLARKSLGASGVPEAADVLKELADRTGETASIGLRRGDDVLVVLSVPSTRPLRYTGRPGERVPLLESAIGAAIVAFGADPLDEAAAVLTRSGHGSPEAWLAETDLLATQFRGYAVLDDPHDEALRAVAAPVVAAGDVVRMAVEIQGPASRLPENALDGLGALVRSAADALEGLPVSMAFGEF